MIEHPKEFRRIYMVSSAVFGAASCVYGWAAPLGAALGLAVNLTEDSQRRQSSKKEFDFAVESALMRTQQETTSNSKKEILEELCQIEIEPDSLSELITKTEAYQTRYCTEADVKEILAIFDMYFKDEIAQRPHLSNLYVLSAGTITLEKLKLLNEILIKNDKKLDEIQNGISDVSKRLLAAQKFVMGCINGIAFILVAMAVFLGMGIFLPYTYDRIMIAIAPVCYGISEFLTFFLSKEGYLFPSMYEGIAKKYSKSKKLWKMFVTFIIPLILTVSCFWIIICATDLKNNNLPFWTLALILGNIASLILKETRFENMDIRKS